ncbi:MAG: hypothetical protein M3Y35_04290, partial [Actinomycetota bacterium]|nr:hypothetical protein [Actinomycetota bacterium]
LPAYVEEMLRSGFPGIRDLPEPARRRQLDSYLYLARIVDHELPDNGIQVRRPAALPDGDVRSAGLSPSGRGRSSPLRSPRAER